MLHMIIERLITATVLATLIFFSPNFRQCTYLSLFTVTESETSLGQSIRVPK